MTELAGRRSGARSKVSVSEWAPPGLEGPEGVSVPPKLGGLERESLGQGRKLGSPLPLEEPCVRGRWSMGQGLEPPPTKGQWPAWAAEQGALVRGTPPMGPRLVPELLLPEGPEREQVLSRLEGQDWWR